MKRKLCIFLASTVLALSAAFPVHAENTITFGIPSDDRGPEELNSIIDQICLHTSSFFDEPVLPENIDLSKATKIYSIDNEEDLPLQVSSKDEAITYLQNSSYFWQLPITIDGRTVQVGIDRVEFIPAFTYSEESIQYINKHMGELKVFCVDVPYGTDRLITYQEQAEGMISRQQGLAGQDWEAVLVYNIYGTMGYGVLLMSEDSVEYLMPLSPPMGLEVPAEILSETSFMDYDGMLLPFSDLQEMIDNRPEPENRGLLGAGGGGDWGLSAEAGCQDKEELPDF